MKARSAAAPSTHAVLATAVVAGILGLLATPDLVGQELRGRLVVEGGPDQPIEGAVVTLLDLEDETVDASFTSPQGTFTVRADSAGDFRVRVDRIGFQRWRSEVFRLDPAAPTFVELEVPIQPVRLADLDVAVYRNCEENPRRAAEVELVWDEARKALESAVLAEEMQLFRYASVIFNRSLTRQSLGVTGVETHLTEGVSRAPFRSLPADHLSRDGYIQEEGATVYYYAPDANVLLSDQFLSEHCFALDRTEIDGRTLIGLEFEPRDGRNLPDISGVLWLDEETARLDHVEFRYENIPYRGVDDGRIAGVVEYARLPTGAFIVRDWFIRMPALLKEENRDRYHIERFNEYGAELREVSRPDGDAIVWREGAGIYGRIVNSLTGDPLRDATLYLDRPRGDDVIRHTGPNGEFFYDRLDPGPYRVSIWHPLFTVIDFDGLSAEVSLAEGEHREVEFALPAADFVLRDLCGRDSGGTAAVVGRVRDLETDFPIDRARVWAEWTELRTGAEPGEGRGRQVATSDAASTDRNGTFVICDLPIGTDMAIRVEASRARSAARSVRTAYLVNVADFFLDDPSR